VARSVPDLNLRTPEEWIQTDLRSTFSAVQRPPNIRIGTTSGSASPTARPMNDGTVVVYTDITELKAPSDRNLSRRARRAEAANRTKSQFLAKYEP